MGDTRFSYPVSLSALAWHVVPTTDGGGRLSWGGPVAPTSTKTSARQALGSSPGEMILAKGTSAEPSQVVVVTSVVVSAPGAPQIDVTGAAGGRAALNHFHRIDASPAGR